MIMLIGEFFHGCLLIKCRLRNLIRKVVASSTQRVNLASQFFDSLSSGEDHHQKRDYSGGKNPNIQTDGCDHAKACNTGVTITVRL